MLLVWRLDRWSRSVVDLLATLQELEHLGVGFVCLRPNPLLWRAIEDRRMIRPLYHPGNRILEPHDHGILNGSLNCWRIRLEVPVVVVFPTGSG
jgi:hypothetical protein